MRLIDADALIVELGKDEAFFDKEAEEARENPNNCTEGYADAMWSRANGIRDAMIEIYDAPTIDLVRCKECKHGSDNKIYGCALIDYNTDEYHRMYADDYCSYGEKEDE